MAGYVGIVVIGAISIVVAIVAAIISRGDSANPDQVNPASEGGTVAIHQPDAEIARVRVVGLSLSFDDAFNLILVFLAAQVVLGVVLGIIGALFYWVVLD